MFAETNSNLSDVTFRLFIRGLKVALPLRLFLLVAALLLGGSHVVCAALTPYWTDGTGNWSIPANWSTGIVPASEDSAFINNGGTATITNSCGACTDLTLGQGSGESGAIQMTGGDIRPGNTYVGYSGTGTISQYAGTYTSYYYLYLGYDPDSEGTYNLSGSAELKTSRISGHNILYGEYVGYMGTGTFNQTGGTNGVHYERLTLGYGEGSHGTYNLSNGTVSFSMLAVGINGVANFNQSGGYVEGVGLRLGSTDSATYDQWGGTVSFVYNDNGSVSVGNLADRSGTYKLHGSGQLLTDSLLVGDRGPGTFDHSAGTVSITHPTAYNMNMSLRIGAQAGSNGTYNLSGIGQLSSVLEFIGYDPDATGLLKQTGGTNTTTYISIGDGGRYELKGGTLDMTDEPGGISGPGDIDASNSTATLLIGSNNIIDFGRANLTNVNGMHVNLGATSLLIVPSGFNPSTDFGTFNCNSTSVVHTAGTTLVVPVGKGFGGRGTIEDPVDCQGTITALSAPNTTVGIDLNGGLNASGAASINLGYGGNLTVNNATSGMTGGSVYAGGNYVGYLGSGTFTHSGGLNKVGSRFHIGYEVGDHGTYNLSGTGELLSMDDENIGYKGDGVFNQSGGTHTLNSSSDLYIGRNRGSTGTYNLSGTGDLIVGIGSNSSSNVYVGFLGDGVFNQSGGSLTVENILYLSYWPYSTTPGDGTYNFTGGTLTVRSIRKGNGNAAFNFGGGTYQPDGNFSIALPMTLTGIGGNANVDTNDYEGTFTDVLSGPGGLNKLGLGTLTLRGKNTYTGNTTVDEGLLALTNSGSLYFDINHGGNSTSILGEGSIDLDGTFVFDLSDLLGAGEWDVLAVDTLTETFGDNFDVEFVSGSNTYIATETSPGVWVYDIPSLGDAIFFESTGSLLVVPEPGMLTLLALGLLSLLSHGRRRKRNA